MAKQLKDYIHYYLGCDFITPNSQGEVNAHTLVHILDMIERGEKVQLCLRKLPSMSEEECADVYTIERDRILHPPTNDHDCRRENDCWKIVRLDHISTTLFITDNAIVFKVTEDNGNQLIEYTRNLPDIFHYLLSKGFDLFGLIDEGLAVDQNTITQTT